MAFWFQDFFPHRNDCDASKKTQRQRLWMLLSLSAATNTALSIHECTS